MSFRRSPAGVPMAPTQDEWDAMSESERAEVIATLPGEVTDAEMEIERLRAEVARLEQLTKR